MLQTHTYGATRLRLERHGLARRVREINLTGARLATAVRDAAARPVWVAGSVSPATAPRRPVRADPGEVAAAVREQVEALVEGGVDLVLLETFSRGAELLAAIDAVREVTDLPVVAQATFVDEDGRPRTAAGESPAEVLEQLDDRGLAAVGTNCTLGPQGLLDVLRRMRPQRWDPARRAAQRRAAPRRVGPQRALRRRRRALRPLRAALRRRRRPPGRRVLRDDARAHRRRGRRADRPRPVDADRPGDRADRADPTRRARPTRRRRPTSGARRARRLPPAGATPGRGGLERWLWARPGTRGFLVAAEVAGHGSPAEQLARARATAAGGAGMLWVSRPRARRATTSTAGLAVHLHDRVEVDTALTVTSWHTSVMALQADLLGLHALGLRAVVCETGNPPLHADQPVRDGLWEVDALGLLRLAAGLNRGIDVDGSELPAATAFRLGARFTPGRRRPRAGGRPCLGEDRGGRRVPAVAPGVRARPVARRGRRPRHRGAASAGAGVGRAALAGFAQAEHLRHEVPDVVVPDDVFDRMRRAGEGPDAARIGLRLAEDLVREAAGLVDGVVVRWSGPARARSRPGDRGLPAALGGDGRAQERPPDRGLRGQTATGTAWWWCSVGRGTAVPLGAPRRRATVARR